MVSDTTIEKRLRELSRQHAKWDSDATVPKKLLIEAADEIVRLCEALGFLVRIEDGNGMDVIGWVDAMKNARSVLGMNYADD